MKKSESIASLAAAFSKAQAEIGGAIKGNVNPAFKSKYADLESVVEAIRPVIGKHGLSYIQDVETHSAAVSVETVIFHESGEWISNGQITIPVNKADAHGFGSALTYCRRYSLSAAFGVAPEDDDGNAAVKAAPERKKFDQEKFGMIADTLENAARRGTEALQAVFKALEKSPEKEKAWSLHKDGWKAVALEVDAKAYHDEAAADAASIEAEERAGF